jgi:hypothetical protein
MEYILAVRIGKYKRNGVSRGFDGHLSVYALSRMISLTMP